MPEHLQIEASGDNDGTELPDLPDAHTGGLTAAGEAQGEATPGEHAAPANDHEDRLGSQCRHVEPLVGERTEPLSLEGDSASEELQSRGGPGQHDAHTG